MIYTKHISYTVGNYAVEFDLKADDGIKISGVYNGTITYMGSGYGRCSNVEIRLAFYRLDAPPAGGMTFSIGFQSGESADAFTVATFGPAVIGPISGYTPGILAVKFSDSQFNPNNSSDYAIYSIIDNYEDYLPESFDEINFYSNENIPIGYDVSFTSDNVESGLTFVLSINLLGEAYIGAAYYDRHILANSSGVTQTVVASKEAIEYCLNYTSIGCICQFYVVYNGFCLASASGNSHAVQTKNFYQNPQLDNLQVRRCLSDGTLDDEGTYLLITYTPTFSSLYGYNSLTVQASYKEASASDYSQEETITSGAIIGGGNIDITNSYNVRLSLTDMKGSFYIFAEVEKSFYLISMKQGGSGIALGQKAVNDNAFDVNLLTNFLKNITIASGCSMTFTDQTTGNSVVVTSEGITITDQTTDHSVNITGEKIEVHTGPIRWWSSSYSYTDYDDIVTTINGPEISMIAFKNDKKNGVIMDFNRVQVLQNDSVVRTNDWYQILA